MKFTNLSATVAVVALLCGAVSAHAQTMSGKGIDTSAASGYGAQLQLDEIKAQQVVNTTAISTQGEQLDDVTGRLDGIDGRLDQIVEQISDLSNSMKTIQETLTQVTSKTETLETVLSENATGEEEPQAEFCPDRNVKVTFAHANSPTALALGTVANGLSTVAVKRKTGSACAGKMGSCKATFETTQLTLRCSPQSGKLMPVRIANEGGGGCMFSGNTCRWSGYLPSGGQILVTVE